MNLLRSKIIINAYPERVWRFIADPQQHRLWNPKVEEVEVFSSFRPGEGYQYEMVYRMGQRVTRTSAKIMRYQEPQLLVIQHRMKDGQNMKNFKMVTLVSYALQRQEDKTLLLQSIDIVDSGIPFIALVIMRFLFMIGKPREKRYLQRLKEAVEQNKKVL